MDRKDRRVVTKLEHLRVMILDDDSFMRHILTETLNQIGVTDVIVQKDGPSALVFILAQEPDDAIDVLLCDLHMPNMDGIEFISKLADSATEIGLDLGLVIVSGADNLIIRMANLLAGAQGMEVLGVLRKPVAKDDLCAVLEKALD